MRTVWQNLTAVVTIATAAVLTALVCFGVLHSSANASAPYALSGAIVGALAVIGVLGRLFRKLEERSDETELRQARLSFDRAINEQSRERDRLQTRIRELETKLLRGAPKPEKFETETDERQQLVFSRPEEWIPRGGNIFSFVQPATDLTEGDVYPAYVDVSYDPIPEQNPSDKDRDEFYHVLRQTFERGIGQYGGPYRAEYTKIGADGGGLLSLRLIARQYVRVTRSPSVLTARMETSFSPASSDDFRNYVTEKVRAIVTRALPSSPNQDFTIIRDRENLVSRILPNVEHQYERGDLRQADIDGFVEEQLDQLDVAHETLVAVAGADQADVGANSVARTESSVPDIVPIAQMWVCCYHRLLKRVYWFQFADDAADFTESSALFNAILSSIRFLT